MYGEAYEKMRIRIFDIRWRRESPELPSILEFPVSVSDYARTHMSRFGGGIADILHHSYFTKPLFFKYVIGNTKKVYTYEYTGV